MEPKQGSRAPLWRRWLRWRNLWVVAALAFVAFIAYAFYAAFWRAADSQDTVVLGQRSLYSDSPAALRVLVRDARTGQPVQNASVRLALEGSSGRTDLGKLSTGRDGSLSGAVQIPPLPPGKYTLVVDSRSRVGRDRIARDVEVKRPCRLYLTTDKPLYQPGQTLHVRAMALNSVTLKPLGAEAITFEVEDPKGNRVFRARQEASRFGIASADFEIADQVSLGRYRVRALAAAVESEKTVTVERYVLPKFKVTVWTQRAYCLPSETLAGRVQAAYFFGKPVSGAQVVLVGRTMVESPVEVFKLTGSADVQGAFEFTMPLPAHFTGIPLAGRDALLELEAKVTDGAGHAEVARLPLTVAREPIKVQALLEDGQPVPGVENLIYILTAYPDGTPAQCTITANGKEAATDASGLAVVGLVPRADGFTLEVTARDESGKTGSLKARFETGQFKGNVLLRTDKAVYRGGETVNVNVLSATPAGACFLDVIKDGQTMLTRSLGIERGRGEMALDLPPSLFGTLKLNAYWITAEGESVASSRVIHVSQPHGLAVTASPDKPIYRPGETARLAFEVRDSSGESVPAALGISAVDEAVFHVSENRPGLLAQFFVADQELLKPMYQIKFAVSPLKLLDPAQADQRLAQALFAAAAAPNDSQRILDELVAGGYLEDKQLIETAREALEKGWYDQMRNDPQYERMLALLRDEGTYTLRAATYAAKQAQIEARLARYRELLEGVVAAADLGIVWLWLPVALFVSGLVKLARCLRGQDPDPTRAIVARAAGGLVHTSWLLLLFPIVTYLLALTVTGFEVMPESSSVLWGFWAVNVLFAAATVACQVRWCLSLIRMPQASRLGREMLAVPVFFSLQFAASSAVVIASSCGWLPSWAGVDAVLASLCAYALTILMAESFSAKAARELNTKVASGSGYWQHLVVGTCLLLLLGMLLPSLEEARGKARSHTPIDDLHDFSLALSMHDKSHPPGAPGQGAAPEPRVRERFPETLLWEPQLITDDSGRATLEVPLADSITNWKVNADAVSAAGALGGTEADVTAFQDFFVDPDLPVSLTRNDEVCVPVACYNYLKGPQSVRLTIEGGDWCALQGPAEQVLDLGPNEVRSVLFRLKALQTGSHLLTVFGRGERMSDAVKRTVQVRPDGTRVDYVKAGTLSGFARHEFPIPADAIPNASSLLLKVYPSRFSEVLEGMENIFRMPYGCFEQTSSCTYPNVLALDYMKRTGQATPEVEVKARKLINAGYQRLLTFEVAGGGFDWFGRAPSDAVLTAYGILEFTDMARVQDVDPAVVDRAKDWLFSKQTGDGSWRPAAHTWTWEQVSGDLVTTAYVTWALAESGAAGREVDAALDYVRRNAGRTEHAYTLVLAANALLAHDRNDATGRELVDGLEPMFVVEGDTARVASTAMGAFYSRGHSLDVETTALAALAMMRSGSHPELVRKALTWVSRQKGVDGNWPSTQATILAMKAMLAGTGAALPSDVTSEVQVTVNGQPAGAIRVTPETSDLLHVLDLSGFVREGSNDVQIAQASTAELPYQLVGACWLPWTARSVEPPKELNIQVDYDRERLAVNDTMTCMVTVRNNGERAVGMAIVDLGIPPGFGVETDAFERMVGSGSLAKYDFTGNQCILYVAGIKRDVPLRFSYELRALYPVKAKAPASRIYEYYNPENEARTAARQFVVE